MNFFINFQHIVHIKINPLSLIRKEIDMGKINQNRTNANKSSRFNPYIFTVILGIIGAAIITAVLISLL